MLKYNRSYSKQSEGETRSKSVVPATSRWQGRARRGWPGGAATRRAGALAGGSAAPGGRRAAPGSAAPPGPPRGTAPAAPDEAATVRAAAPPRSRRRRRRRRRRQVARRPVEELDRVDHHGVEKVVRVLGPQVAHLHDVSAACFGSVSVSVRFRFVFFFDGVLVVSSVAGNTHQDQCYSPFHCEHNEANSSSKR